MEDNKQLFSTIDNLLSNVDLKDVTAESTGFQNLPDGYYLSEVVSAKLTTSKAGQPMAAFTFKIVEDGKSADVDANGNSILNKIKNSKGRQLWMYYVLKDEQSIKRFVQDMLKFEGDEPGVPLLEKECFTKAELINEALECLTGMRIFINISTSIKEDADGKEVSRSTWQNLISWKRAKLLEL